MIQQQFIYTKFYVWNLQNEMPFYLLMTSYGSFFREEVELKKNLKAMIRPIHLYNH